MLSAARPAPVYKLLAGVSSCTQKCTLGRKQRAGLQFSGQLRADKTTQANATDTTAAGGAPEQTYHRHLRPLIRRDAFAIEGKSKKGSNAKVLRDPVNHDVWSLFCIFFPKQTLAPSKPNLLICGLFVPVMPHGTTARAVNPPHDRTCGHVR